MDRAEMDARPEKPSVSLVVEDVDNTKYDFFGSWAKHFETALNAMADSRCPDPAQRPHYVAQVMKEVGEGLKTGSISYDHVYHDVGEALLRTPTINPEGRFHPQDNPGGREEYRADEAKVVAQWFDARLKDAKAFDGVVDTLAGIRAAGARDVVWTDANVSSLLPRLPAVFGGNLAARGVDRVYCQPDPQGAVPDPAALQRISTALGVPVVVLSGDAVGVKDTRKPSQETFQWILRNEGESKPSRVAIIGDSYKDFSAAQWVDKQGKLLPADQRPTGIWQKQGADGASVVCADGQVRGAVVARTIPMVRVIAPQALDYYPLGAAMNGARVGQPRQLTLDGKPVTTILAPPDKVVEAGPGAPGYRQLLDLVKLVPAEKSPPQRLNAAARLAAVAGR